MARYIQENKIPPNKILNFSLKDFSGGMNNRSDQIEDNEGAVVKNLMFADDTVLETRYGSKYYNDVEYDGEIVFIDEFKPYRDEDQLVVGTTTTLYIGDKSVPLKGKPSGINHLGHYYFSDGESLKVYGKFNQEHEKSYNPITDKEFQKSGKDPDRYLGMTSEEKAESAVTLAEEKKTSEYIRDANKYVDYLPVSKRSGFLTRIKAIVETDEPDTDLTSIYFKTKGTALEGYHFYDVVSPKDNHDRLGKEHLQGVTTVDYDKGEVYYEPCDNEFLDSLLGANKIPEKVKYLASHTGRVFASGHDKDDDNVFISDLQNPLYFAVGLPIQIPPTSDKITGMHVFDNSVVLGRQNDIYTISGSTNRRDVGVELFKLKRLNTHTGFASHLAVDIAHNYLMFLGSDGNVYAIQSTRGQDRELSTIILSRTIDLEASPIDVDKADYKKATSYFHKDEWFLTIGDKTMVYNYRHMSWLMYTDLNMRSCYGFDNGEWIWGRPDGRLAMFDEDNFFDFGEPYESLWYSKMFDMDDANSFKQFREFYLVAHTFDDYYSDIYVTFEIDYEDVRTRAIISNQIARWGYAKFGDRFVTRNINESVPFIIGRRGRNIRFKITNGYELSHEVDNYSDLEYIPEKKEGLFVKVTSDNTYYLYVDREWVAIEEGALNQRMKVYQVNGDFEMRGKR